MVGGVQSTFKPNIEQAVKTGTFSTPSYPFVDVPGLSVTITTKSDTSKVMVEFSGVACNTAGGNSACFNLLRDGVSIYLGDAAGTRTRVSGFSNPGNSNYGVSAGVLKFLDSPATKGPVTYTIQMATQNTGGGTAVLGMRGDDADTVGWQRAASTLTAEEVPQ